MMQYLNIELAWWFNVGVQIFLCISGYLYGQKTVGSIPEFYCKRLRKIYIPYLLTVLPYGLLVFLFARDEFKWNTFIYGLFAKATLKGSEHLWFIAYILMCYLITPILEAFRDRYLKSRKSMWIFAICSVCITALCFGLFIGNFNPIWIICYVIGYSFGANERGGYIRREVLVRLFTALSLVFNGIQIYLNYILRINLSGRLQTIYTQYCNCSHVLLGASLFLMMLFIFERMQFGDSLKKFLDQCDHYSYEIYLVHQLVILGPFSLMALTPVLTVNIILILVVIAVLAIVLDLLSNRVNRLLTKICFRRV